MQSRGHSLRTLREMIEVQKVSAPSDLEKVFSIRRKVFVDEQRCPPELEWANEEESVHFLATVDGEPCGAARWRKTGNGFKLERFAVLPAFRNHGVGESMVRAVLADLPSHSIKIYLNAQIAAVRFYERLGFHAVGEKFEEAGIMHQQMELSSAG